MSRSDLRITFLDAATFGDVSFDGFTAQWDCTIHALTAPEEILPRLQGYQVAIVNKVILNRSILDSPGARDLKLIAVAATGTDNVEIEAARARGICVCNVPGYAAQSVAQFTVALILELATRAGGYMALVRRGARELMNPNAFLVNTARGALIDEAALIQALRQKRLAGAALDVISREPPPSDHPVIRAAKELDNLLVTPHCAWSTREARRRLLDEVAENILAFLRGEERNRLG